MIFKIKVSNFLKVVVVVPLQDILHLVSLVGLLLCLGLHPIAIKRRKTHQGSANFINKKVKNVPGYLAKFLDF